MKQSSLSHFELSIELGSITLSEGAHAISDAYLICSCGLFLTADGQLSALTTQPPVDLTMNGTAVPLTFSRFVVEFASPTNRINSVIGKHEVKLELWTKPNGTRSSVRRSTSFLVFLFNTFYIGVGGRWINDVIES